MENDYYYNSLSKDGKKAYYAIKEGLLELKESFPVIKLSTKELSDIFFMVRLDNPKIFYTNTFSYRYYPDSTMVELVPNYIFGKDKIREHAKALDARIKKLVSKASELNEIDKELYIHDFLVDNVKYDKLKKEYSHEIIGALTNGVAVCEGIAKAFKVMCDELGIWCIVALSNNNEEKGIKYRHAWNVVRIGGKYYHIDATFDNTITRDGINRYDYVNLSDKQVFRDHESLVYKVPECVDSDNYYYKLKKLSWTTLDEVRKRAAQAVKKGRPLVFNWRGGYLNRDIMRELIDIFEEEAHKKDKQSIVSVNFAQAVIRVRFEAGTQAEDYEIEDVNEGENIIT